MEPLRINLRYRQTPGYAWTADVWVGDDLRVTGYGLDKREALEEAQRAMRLWRMANRWQAEADAQGVE
jgi:hypothetical protein